MYLFNYSIIGLSQYEAHTIKYCILIFDTKMCISEMGFLLPTIVTKISTITL